MGHSVEDLMFLLGYKKRPARFGSKWDAIKIQAENDWQEGKNADRNPYNKDKQPQEYNLWYSTWLDCNKNC